MKIAADSLSDNQLINGLIISALLQIDLLCLEVCSLLKCLKTLHIFLSCPDIISNVFKNVHDQNFQGYIVLHSVVCQWRLTKFALL